MPLSTTLLGSARGFLALFGFQVLLNVLVVAQQRAAATVALGPSFVSNVLLAGVSYLAVRKVVEGRSPSLAIGYALGGGVGGTHRGSGPNPRGSRRAHPPPRVRMWSRQRT